MNPAGSPTDALSGGSEMTVQSGRDLIARAAVIGMLLTACSGGPGTSTGANQSPAATSLSSATTSRAPAEGQIAFVGFEVGRKRGQIYLERADGSGITALVASAFDDESPALSPDGRKVAFARTTADGSTALGAYVVNIDGTGLRKIDANGENPSWSPDGTQLVETRALFDPGASAPYNVALWIVNLESGNARQITRNGVRCPNACADGGQDGEARWSPDGTRLVFLQETYISPEQFSIFTMAADGSDMQRVTPVGMNVADPHWSPDGRFIVFQSPPDPSEHYPQDIYTIHADGTSLTQLTADLSAAPAGLEAAFHPSWSPDGRQIVFSHFPGSTPNGASLYVMNADGTDLHLVAPTTLDQNAAEWGPMPASP